MNEPECSPRSRRNAGSAQWSPVATDSHDSRAALRQSATRVRSGRGFQKKRAGRSNRPAARPIRLLSRPVRENAIS
jgi:hypothetical protein